MKRKLLRSVLAIMVLGLTFACGCSGKGAETSNSTSSELKEPETLSSVCLNIADNINGKASERVFRTAGRTFFRYSGLACDLSCTGVRFNALCKGEVKMRFRVTADTYFTVFINGKRSNDRIRASLADNGTMLTIANFDEYGEYEIEVLKQSQYPMSYCEMLEVEILGSFGKRPAERERFIECYGDSLMNGSNIYKGGTSAASSDATRAYGFATAHALNADCNVVGRGGMALNRKDDKTDGLLEIWDLCGGTASPEVADYGFTRIPDCIVINIGTNDYRAGHTPGKYADGIREMIFNFRSVYGDDVKIIWCYGYGDTVNELWNSVTKSTLDSVNSNGTIYYCELPVSACPKSEGGDGLHPDVARAEKMAEALTKFINENIYC
jgi:lysophospholipase L1-like esterase